MPHIHTLPGQIDFIAEVFCVYQDKVLLRLHEKYHIWIAPGGHVELNETPEEAAVREVKEEVGLDVILWRGLGGNTEPKGEFFEGYQELIVPAFMNAHSVSSDHRHISLVYFGTVETDAVVQPDTHEHTECRWMTREEVEMDSSLTPPIRRYALEALGCLSKNK